MNRAEVHIRGVVPMPENGLPLPLHHGDHPYQVGSILPDRSLIAAIEVGLV